MKKIQKQICFLVALVSWPMQAISSNTPIFLGVLEQSPQCRKKSETSARILFYKKENKWHALGVSAGSKPSTTWDIETIKWTISLEGRNIGKLQMEEPPTSKTYANDWYYRRDKLHHVRFRDSLPKIKNPEMLFTGWCNTPEYRPLIINSKGNYKDLEKWESFKANNSYKEKLFPFLKISVGKLKLIRCKYDPSYHSAPYKFKSAETVIYEGYRSSVDKELVSIGLDVNMIDCEGPREPEWTGNWFLIDGMNVDFIGREMELVDMGDYDGDGKTEHLFWYSGYNRDGYVLIYNDFTEKTEYLWSYH